MLFFELSKRSAAAAYQLLFGFLALFFGLIALITSNSEELIKPAIVVAIGLALVINGARGWQKIDDDRQQNEKQHKDKLKQRFTGQKGP